MDTVIGNRYLDIFNNLDIEVSKKLEGVYTIDDIISTFGNFFFNRMFLDITSIKDYKDVSNLQKLSMNLDMSKIILLLDKDDIISSSNSFLSKLVSMGIYNFTSDSTSLMYLYRNPNLYRDVAHYQNINDNTTENVISESTYTKNNKIILGIKNVTENAGATTFCYLLKEALSNYYSTMLIEIDRRDFTFLNDKDSLSIKESELDNVIHKYDGVNCFIVDINDSKIYDKCTDVLYLVEPSSIKLNKLMAINPSVINFLRDKKVILNRLSLSDKDINDFEVESTLKVFYNVGCVNDKEDNTMVFLPLLSKLGFYSITNIDNNSNNKSGIFTFFRK